MKIIVGRSIVLLISVAMIGTGLIGEVRAQQWPAQSQPVRNSLPQYRSPRSNSSDRLPLDFFENTSSIHGDQRQAPASPQNVQDTTRGRVEMPAPRITPAKMLPQPAVRPLRSQVNMPPSSQMAMPVPATPKPVARKASAAGQPKSKQKPLPVIDESIYRDMATYPIDHRKPCWQCGQGRQCESCLSLGNQGRPYSDKVYGGCECDSKKPCKHPNFSVHWPRPFSANLDARYPGRAAKRYDGCPDKYIVDVFNPLSKIKLSKYKRTDNGYCGDDSDPYGCLGESKLR